MAATRLIALHVNKGKTVAQCLADRTDYSQNASKTNDGEFISSYECDPKTADEEFLLSKRQYQHITGRQQKNNIIAYQIRQSFKPGEITPEEANQVGYVYVDGIYLKRNWGGEFENVSILVAIGVDADGYREIIGAAEGMKEDSESWKSFLVWLKERGLDDVKLIVGDKCLGMCNAVAEVFPEAKYQRCTVHFYRNVFSVVPRNKMREVTRMLKAIHAQESKEAARKKAKDVVEQLKGMKLKEAAKKVEDGIEETLTYMDFPSQHWLKIRTNNVIERMNREIRRRTRVVGTFPDGKSALMLVCARLRYVSGKEWGTKRYLCMKYLTEVANEVA